MSPEQSPSRPSRVWLREQMQESVASMVFTDMMYQNSWMKFWCTICICRLYENMQCVYIVYYSMYILYRYYSIYMHYIQQYMHPFINHLNQVPASCVLRRRQRFTASPRRDCGAHRSHSQWKWRDWLRGCVAGEVWDLGWDDLTNKIEAEPGKMTIYPTIDGALKFIKPEKHVI